ncbi:MAG: glycosyltransferase family 2 protein [Pseudonocardiaceae bacterium]
MTIAHEPYTIIIPTRGDPAALRRIAAQIAAFPEATSFLILVNRSRLMTSRYGLESLRDLGVTFGFCPGGGVARVRNLALRMVSTDVVVFVDDDAATSVEAVARLTRELDDGRTGVVTGRVVPAASDSQTFMLYRDFFGFDRGAIARRFSGGVPPPPMQAWQLGVGAVFAVRRTLLDAVASPPSFDESLSNGRFCGGAEDVDFFLQCLHAGIGLSYCADAVFWHEFPSSVGVLRRKITAYARADGAFYCKWRHDIGPSAVARDLLSWAARVQYHAVAKVKGSPHLPLVPVLAEPVEKLIGAVWWRCFATS